MGKLARVNTQTYEYGSSGREGHDSSPFYSRNLFSGMLPPLQIGLAGLERPDAPPVPVAPQAEWADRVYAQDAQDMARVPDASVGLCLTSPPYNAGKVYDEDLDLPAYFRLILKVGAQVYRVLKPGGRYVVNIANLGRKPYVPMTAYFYALHLSLGFLPAGEIVWRKGKGMNGSCAWGSWRSAKAPRLRDVHEPLLIFAKERFERPDRGASDISAKEFMEATLSVWDIQPESARRIGHPAPFPVELADRVVKLLSYQGDVVLDPFNGSGTTCVAALQNGRHYVGYDISAEYCDLARHRIAAAAAVLQARVRTGG